MPYIGRGPSKSGAFRILDDVSGSFNGSTTSFALTVGSTALTVGLPETLLIAVDGVVQEAGTAYTISGSNIVFTAAPQESATFWGVELGDVGGLADRATTQSASDNSTKVATTAYVDAQVATEDTIAELNDTTITSIASGEVLKWSGSAWINNTLVELGVAALSGAAFTGDITGVTSLTVDNLLINGNTISSTAGTDLLITPLGGQQIVLDGTIIIDAGVVTGATSITSTEFVGGGVGLTALNATQLTSGTMPDARFPATLPAISGANLTGISAGIASLAADTSPQLGGALDVNGQSIVSASNGDINIIPNGTGSIGLNTTGVSAYLVEIGGAFQGTIDESAGLYINPTITGAAGGSTYVARIKGTIVEAGSGTHPIAIGLAVNTPIITNAGAALTTSATLWVQGEPSGATTNYAVYVDGGKSRFDGNVGIGNGADGNAKLHVRKAAAVSGSGAADSGSVLVVESNDEASISLVTPNNRSAFFKFVSNSSGGPGYIQYVHGSNFYVFSAGAENFRIYGNGNITSGNGSTTFHTGSDVRIKENITDSSYGLAEVLQLRSVKFNFADWHSPNNNPTRVGLIAQEVEEVLPELVGTNPQEISYTKYDDDVQDIVALHEPLSGLKAIDDQQMISVLIRAIQELNARIDGLS